MKRSDIDLGIGLWRELERHGIRPNPNLIIKLLGVLDVHVRRQEIYRVFAPFRNVHDTRAEQGRNTFSRSTEHLGNTGGTEAERSSRAHGKGITDHKDPEETFGLFSDTGRADAPPPKRRSKTRDLAVYAAADAIWNELQPQLRVPITKTAWRSKNLDAAENLVAALGSADAAVQAWRDSCEIHGEVSVTLARVIDDINFSRIGGPRARSPAKEKTARQRGFREPEPENFKPRTFEREL